MRRLAVPGPGQAGLQGALDGGEYETPDGRECSSFQHLFLLFSALCLSSSASGFPHSRCCNTDFFFQTVHLSRESFTQHVSPTSCQKPHSDVSKWSVQLVSTGLVHYSLVLISSAGRSTKVTVQKYYQQNIFKASTVKVLLWFIAVWFSLLVQIEPLKWVMRWIWGVMRLLMGEEHIKNNSHSALETYTL